MHAKAAQKLYFGTKLRLLAAYARTTSPQKGR